MNDELLIRIKSFFTDAFAIIGLSLILGLTIGVTSVFLPHNRPDPVDERQEKLREALIQISENSFTGIDGI